MLIGIGLGAWGFKYANDAAYRRVAVGILFVIGIASTGRLTDKGVKLLHSPNAAAFSSCG